MLEWRIVSHFSMTSKWQLSAKCRLVPIEWRNNDRWFCGPKTLPYQLKCITSLATVCTVTKYAEHYALLGVSFIYIYTFINFLWIWTVLYTRYLPENAFQNGRREFAKFCSTSSVNRLFYHDVDETFWPQPIILLKLGHVTGQGSMSLTWVGRVSDLGKNGFHKKFKNLENIAVYLIASLKSKWKNKQMKNMNGWIW